MSRQTPAALARRAAYEAAQHDPYTRIARQAREDAEAAYRAGALSAEDGSVLDLEVTAYRLMVHRNALFGRCIELEAELERVRG